VAESAPRGHDAGVSLATPAHSTAVSARGLVRRFGDLVAVNGVDLEVRRSSCMGVLGPNGAGKTTMIEMLEGIQPADEGEVEVLGRGWKDDAKSIRERIGVQLQETTFPDRLKVREVLRVFRSFYQEGRTIEEVLALVGLEEKSEAQVKTLSGGQKQRLSIGCALLNRPEVLFLDEPTTGLDPQARRRVWEVVESVKAAGGTILLTTHYMEEAERLADELIIIDRGKVITRGSPASIIASLGAQTVVEFGVAGSDARAIPDSVLLGIPGVRAVRAEGSTTVLTAVHAQSVISGLFAVAQERGIQLEDLRTHRATLEDVFVALTGKHLRDG